MAAKPGPVLVTGANSGIGLATTLRLADRGWETWGTVRSKTKGKALTDAAEHAGVADLVKPLVLDVSNHDAVVARWPELPAVLRRGQQRRLLRARCRRGGHGASGPRPARRQRRRASGRVVVRPAGDAGAWVRAHRDGVVDRRPGGLHAAERLVPRVQVRPRGTVGRPAHRGRRVRGQGVDRRAGLLQDRHRRSGAKAAGERTAGEASPYRTAYQRAARALDAIERLAPAPDIVARVIVSAIESSRPRHRYLVGADAMSVALTHPLTPRSVTDAAARLFSGLGGRPETFA